MLYKKWLMRQKGGAHPQKSAHFSCLTKIKLTVYCSSASTSVAAVCASCQYGRYGSWKKYPAELIKYTVAKRRMLTVAVQAHAADHVAVCLDGLDGISCSPECSTGCYRCQSCIWQKS